MSRILIGIISAHHPSRWHYRSIQREQCLKDSPLPYLYVMGGEPSSFSLREPNTLYADCPDDVENMVLKDQALFRYALDNEVDYCFRCCDDTWLFPDRLAKANLEQFDYAGQVSCKINLGGTFKIWMKYFDYMHGGCGIWLSKKSMDMLVADEWKGPRWTDTMPELLNVGLGMTMPRPKAYYDDHWIGEVLKGNLSWDDPARANPVSAYANNGIAVLEDEMVFFNDDPSRPISIHDPGRIKMIEPMTIYIPPSLESMALAGK